MKNIEVTSKVGESFTVRRIIKKKWSEPKASFLFISIATLLAFLYPLTVTWDGYLYIGSGFSLFTNNFLTDYHWLREPAYPIFIRICYAIGGYTFLIFIQFSLLTIAILQTKRLIEKLIPIAGKRNLWIGSYLALFTLAGYAATILQQVLFISITVALMSLLQKKESSHRLMGIGLLSILAALTSVLLFVGLCAAIFFLAVIKGDLRKNVAKISLPFIIFSSCGIMAESTWYVFKNSQNTSISKYQDNVNFWEKPQGSTSLYDTVTKIPAIFAAVNSFGPGNDQNMWQSVGLENRIYGTPLFTADQICGKFIYGPQDYISKVKIPLISKCSNSEGISILNSINRILGALIPFISLFGLFLMLLLSRNSSKSGFVVLFLPALSQFPYLVANYGGSRYGVPQLVLACFMFPLAVSHFLTFIFRREDKVNQVINKRTSRLK